MKYQDRVYITETKAYDNRITPTDYNPVYLDYDTCTTRTSNGVMKTFEQGILEEEYRCRRNYNKPKQIFMPKKQEEIFTGYIFELRIFFIKIITLLKE